jgi:glycosyltransferase involved in cell wall biosynthesis
MIVKDESLVIQRCLNSLKSFIDYWVIVDTGSTDGTQKLIEETLREIPGELHETPWVNFAHCRNQALELAKGKGDYLLFLDADEIFVPDNKEFDWPPLSEDCYFAYFLLDQETIIQRLFLANGHLEWKWKGALHEELTTDTPRTGAVLEKAKIRVIQDGRRSQDPNKHLKDAELLKKELQSDPQNSRTLFYLAGSYEMAKQDDLALEAYRKRAEMGGWSEELYHSLYRIAVLEEKLQMPSMGSYCKAYTERPTRAEPLFLLGRSLIDKKRPFLAYLLAAFALRIPFPEDRTFVEREVYDYKLLTQKADAAVLLGRYGEAATLLRKSLNGLTMPKETREKVETALYLMPRETLDNILNP